MQMTIYWDRKSTIISHLDCRQLSAKLGKSMSDRGQMIPLGLVGINPLFYCIDCACIGVFNVSHPTHAQIVDIVALRVDGDGDND